ncbi:hypothetical protein LNKW23_07200 [Paralimibaculum aggregatum]|uniref:Metalloprotease n=1 Tax=Paralimibaculum aggregatum TaxID=3036245 RepID=A0ABQ6LEV4_9RHOB|nr:hypothetical protein [Limibaculum sp. NKW23]GMG81507.1 hypothetical protein LNKW23_07200 [Limibaculum sp. NKW23]
MSFSLSAYFEGSGTRFRLHPQSPVLEDFREPETVWLSSPRGSLAPGPSDRRMYALTPIAKRPYLDEDCPPYCGPVHPPAMPGPDGHFDHVAPDSPAFLAVHMFGSIRRVLDIWEVYSGGPVPWHFQMSFPRLELIAHVPWRNAHFGSGYCECGEDADDAGVMRPFALNFDIIAHEVGHGLVFAIAGIPPVGTLTTDYLAFHESASDLVAIVSALHFESFVDHILRRTKGDLHAENELNRIGELSGTRQIRSASNALRLPDLAYRGKPPDQLTGHQIHELGQPLTGAFFDIGVEFFIARLVALGVVTPAEAALLREVQGVEDLDTAERARIRARYLQDPALFRRAIRDARDMLGLRLARSWHRLRPQNLHFGDVSRCFLISDRELSGSRYTENIRECFAWRGIIADM